MSEAERGSVQNLLAGLAHELSTPLGAIRSNRDVLQRVVNRLSEILADDVVDSSEVGQVRELVEKLAEVIEIDRAAVDAMSDLVVSARSCWRPDDKVMRCVDLHDGLDSALLLLRHQFKNRIEVVREYGDLPEVECYPSQVNQVFINLLLNASQAIPERGTITIRSYIRDGRVAIEISDTGSGIPAEHLDRIFDAGFTTKRESGMGLGLNICREIVEQQGGAIEVQSTVGKGSTFTVLLPVRSRKGTGAQDR
jgi:two-component system NtrC family sensor kinase